MDDVPYQRALAELRFTENSHLLTSSPSGAASVPASLSSAIPATTATTLGNEVDRSLHPSGIVPTLQNVVSTCSLGCPLNLKRIAQHARNAEYNPKRFAAVIMRIREPKTTALIFSSGKMVCTGAKSEQDSRLASRKYAKIVSKLGYHVVFQDFQIQNIVGSCDVRFYIGLESLNFKHRLFSRYEPELFPGLIYKMKVPKVVLLIFVSGKVVLTGARTRKDIYQAFENIYPALTEFRKGKRKSSPETSQTVQGAEAKCKTTFANDLRRETKSSAVLSPFLSSMSQSLQSMKEDSKSFLAAANDDSSGAFVDSFHSRLNPFTLPAAVSGDFGSGHIQRAPPTPQVTHGPPATPYAHFMPPPTPQT